MTYVHRMAVRFADVDIQGHMYFANYFVFCDEAFGGYMRHIGCPWQSLLEEGVDMFYVSARCDYRGSVTFENLVDIETRISRIGESSVVSSYIVRAPDSSLVAEAELTSVCVDVKTRRPTRVPERLRAAVAALG